MKEKHKTRINSFEKITKLINRSKNRAIYNKISYNHDVVTIFLIINKKKYNFLIIQEFISKIVATIKFFYNLMSNFKKNLIFDLSSKIFKLRNIQLHKLINNIFSCLNNSLSCEIFFEHERFKTFFEIIFQKIIFCEESFKLNRDFE